MDYFTLNWVNDFSYDELEFEHVDELAIQYKSFLMNDEPEYDVFDLFISDQSALLSLTESIAEDPYGILTND